jgi:predicted ATP-grasp superfamily ATP-dependent carboligase
MPPPDTVDALVNKEAFYRLAIAEGWPVPLTWSAGSEAELRGLLDQVSFPCILKPRLKNSAFRKQPLPKAFKPRSAAELIEMYRLVAPFEPEVIVSEWIEGPDDHVISCRGHWDREGKPVLRFVSQKLLQWPPELGGMVAMNQAPLEWWPDCIALADRIFERTRMYGIGALECKLRPDGRLAITEPTIGRTPMSHEIAPINGFDIAWACYCDVAFGVRVPEPVPTSPGIKLINPEGARMAAKESVSRGLLTGNQVRVLLAGPSRQVLWRREDPLPWIITTARQSAIRLAVAARRWIKGARPPAGVEGAGAN